MNITICYIIIFLLIVALSICIYFIFKLRKLLVGTSVHTKKCKSISELNNDLSLLMKAAGLSAWIYDIASGTRKLIYGKKIIQDSLTYDNYSGTIHPDDISILLGAKKRIINGDISEDRIVVRYLPTNELQSFHYMECYTIAKKINGKINSIACLNRDITTQVLFQQALEENRAKVSTLSHEYEKNNLLLKAILDRMPCLLFIKDADDDFRYIIANSLFCKSLGKPEDEVVGHTEYDLMSTKEEADAFRRDDVEAMGKGIISFREETQWCGVRTVWHTFKSSFIASSGQHLLIGMSLDITALDDTMAQLRKAKEKAERSDLLKSAFLANMSHEIRTPLNAIIGFSDLIVHSEDKNEKEEYSKIIYDNSDLLLKLINDILDLSKIEARFVDIKISHIDIYSLFDEFEHSFAPRMKSGVKFICNNPYSSFYFESDKNRIIQIVNNFMSNAMKYTPSGHITLGYEQYDNGLKIYVEDSGIGVKDEDKCRLFKRFEKLDSFAQGTGLGLSICKVIAETLGGSVGFESTYGQGSTFYVYLPLEAVKNQHIVDVAPTNSTLNDGSATLDTIPKKINVLVAEDNDSNFILIQSILKNYLVDRAKNGYDVVNMAKIKDYSIIFMDIKMPMMDGMEATRQIRAFNTTTPIIAITANAFDSDKEEALKAGCDSFLSKPIKYKDIINIMNTQIHS